jgi:hypothetical protein
MEEGIRIIISRVNLFIKIQLTTTVIEMLAPCTLLKKICGMTWDIWTLKGRRFKYNSYPKYVQPYDLDKYLKSHEIELPDKYNRFIIIVTK